MKLQSQISMILGLAAFCAAPAFATSPATAPDVTLNVSGSSAAVPILEAMHDALCAAGTKTELRGVASAAQQTAAGYNASDLNFAAYYCTYAGAKVGTLAGKNVLVNKLSAGGSVGGVNAVAFARPLGFMVISAANCVDVSAGNGQPAGSQFACLNTVKTNLVPDAGISDVEPTLLQIPQNFPTGQTDANGVVIPTLTANQIATGQDSTGTVTNAVLRVQFPFAQNFGIAVSDNLFQAGLTNLSKSQITSILAQGRYTDWASVSPTLTGTINVCFRTPGSGTRAGAQAFFLDIGCKPTGAATLRSGNINLGSGAGNVRTCLNGTNSIGILGIADGPNAPPNTTDTWHFISIDGIAPTQANFGTGLYQDWVMSADVIRTTAFNGVLPLTDPANATKLQVFNVLHTEFGDEDVIKTLAAVTGNTHLTDAILSLDQTTLASHDPIVNGNAYAFDPLVPIAWATKNNNTCRAPQLTYP